MLFKQVIKKLFAASLAIMLIVPLGGLLAADEKGEITIEVINESGEPYVGSWFLHQGPNQLGIIKRNGSSGETFKMDTGRYFIVANGKGTHRYTQVISENPQSIKVNGEITYKVQYFKDESERNKVRAQVEAAKKAREEAEAKAKAEEEAKKKAEEEAAKKEGEKAETNKETQAKEEVKTPVKKVEIDNETLARQKEEERRKLQEEMAMRQKAAELAKQKTGTGNVVNEAQRRAEEAKKAREETETEKKVETTKEMNEEEKAEDAATLAKIEEIKKRAAGKAKAAEIRAAREAKEKAELETKANANSTSAASKLLNAPALAATGNPLLFGLMLPSIMGGLAIVRRKK